QSTVGWAERGVVTGTNAFGRSIGSALGVAILGAVANTALGPNGPTPSTLDTAAHRVFVGVLIAAVLMLVAVATLRRVIQGVDGRPTPGRGADGGQRLTLDALIVGASTRGVVRGAIVG